MKNILLVLPLLLAMAGCASSVDIKTAPVVIPPPPAPRAEPLDLKPVQWHLVTKDDLPALLETVKKNPNGNFVLYTLDTQNFENMNLNMEELRRYIKEECAVIIFYEKYNNVIPDTDPVAPSK